MFNEKRGTLKKIVDDALKMVCDQTQKSKRDQFRDFFCTKFSLTLIQRLFGTKFFQEFFQYQMVSDTILEMERDRDPNQHQNSDEKF